MKPTKDGVLFALIMTVFFACMIAACNMPSAATTMIPVVGMLVSGKCAIDISNKRSEDLEDEI